MLLLVFAISSMLHFSTMDIQSFPELKLFFYAHCVDAEMAILAESSTTFPHYNLCISRQWFQSS